MMPEDAAAPEEASGGRGSLLPPLSPVTIVVGHYGSGKTNLAINLALDARAAGADVVLADLDVVNPYFRSSDYAADLERAGVRVVSPVLAGTSLDTPSLSGTVATAIDEAHSRSASEPPVADGVPAHVLVIDAGGDDVGATALGRFAPGIAAGPYAMIAVANRYRNLTQDASDAVEVVREIERASGLSVTGVANNSHLKADTEVATVLDSLPYGEAVATELDVPLVCVTAPISVAAPIRDALRGSAEGEKFYPVKVYVRTPWE